MPPDINIINSLLENGGVAGSVLAVLLVLRFAWKTIGRDFLERTKNSAETNIITTMSDEIGRLNLELQALRKLYMEEIENLKKSHASDMEALRSSHNTERLALSDKLARLEQTFEDIRRRNESMKASALSAYALLNTLDSTDDKKLDEIKDSLLALVFKDPEN